MATPFNYNDANTENNWFSKPLLDQ